MAWLIIQHDEDKYGFIKEPDHKHYADWTKAKAEWERLITEENRRVTLMTDPEYNALYNPEPVSA